MLFLGARLSFVFLKKFCNFFKQTLLSVSRDEQSVFTSVSIVAMKVIRLKQSMISQFCEDNILENI